MNIMNIKKKYKIEYELKLVFRLLSLYKNFIILLRFVKFINGLVYNNYGNYISFIVFVA